MDKVFHRTMSMPICGLNIAASSGDKDAVKYRDIAAGMMTPSQITEAQKHRNLPVNVSVRNTRIVGKMNHSAAQKDVEICDSPV